MLKNLSIRSKLIFLVGLFAVGFTIYSAIVWVKTAERLEDSEYADVMKLKGFQSDIAPPAPQRAYGIALTAAPLAGNKAALAKVTDQIQEEVAEFDKNKQDWHEAFGGTQLGEQINSIFVHASSEMMSSIQRDYLPALEANDPAAIAAATTKLDALVGDYRNATDDVLKKANEQETIRAKAAAGAIATRKIVMALVAVLFIAVCGAIGLVTARGINRRLGATGELLERVAGGDYTCRLDVDSNDEIGKMSKSLNLALLAVDAAFGQVREVAAQMAGAASTLAQSSEQISSGAQAQAASLEETAASLEEITATVKQSAGNAQQASQLATSSRETAENGGAVVNDAVRAMNEVSTASRRIGDIITTIDEIALQTNLLALNAAVEAARAGEQGRGFAVVAAEVGNLAQRSATAAKEVKTLIQDALARVEAGHGLVGESGRALSEIITSVKKVTDIFGEIAAAAREQSAGVDQVNEAVAQMDRVTQSNSAQTAELSRTAEELSGQASQLDDLLNRFTLSTNEAPAKRNDQSQPRAKAPASKKIVVEESSRGPRPARTTFNRLAGADGDAFEVL